MIAKQAGEQLAPVLHRIVPKLYRYQFDPNPKIQAAMSSIWVAIVTDQKTTVRSHCLLRPIQKHDATSDVWISSGKTVF